MTPPNSWVSSNNGATACFRGNSNGRRAEKTTTASRLTANVGRSTGTSRNKNYLYFYDKTRPVAEQGFTKINATHDTHPYGGGPWPQGHGIGYADTFVIEIANFSSCGSQRRNRIVPDFCRRRLPVSEYSTRSKRSYNERKMDRDFK